MPESNLLSWAKVYVEAGFGVMPLHGIDENGLCTCGKPECGSPGKHPKIFGGTDAALMHLWQLEEYFGEGSGANIGLALDSETFVVDIDRRNGGMESLHQLSLDGFRLPATLEEHSGDGLHLYFGVPEGICISSRVIARGIDIIAKGKYVCAAPSRHRNGKFYEFLGGQFNRSLITPAPDWLVERCTAPRVDGYQQSAFSGATTKIRSSEKTQGPVKGERNERVFRFAAGLRAKGVLEEEAQKEVLCFAQSCQPPLDAREALRCLKSAYSRYPTGWPDKEQVKSIVDKMLKSEERGPGVPLKSPYIESLAVAKCDLPDFYADIVVAIKKIFKTTKKDLESAIRRAHRERKRSELDDDVRLVFNDKGELLPILPNLIVLIERMEQIRGKIGYDAFANSPVFLEGVGWGNLAPGATVDAGSQITETDYLRIESLIVSQCGQNVQQRLVFGAVRIVAERNAFHPVRDYLRSLNWDGQSRISSFASRYLGVDDSDYTALVIRIFLISAVARVMQPGCKVDTVLVLEGYQGTKKSTFLFILAGGWFADTNFELGSKDGFLTIQSVWIYEFPELSSIAPKEVEKVKAFLTSREDRFRVPYGRTVERFPRQVVFVGTTNEADYLKDATGNRRFLPLRCGCLNLDAVRDDRDQIWAEAMHLFLHNTPWWAATEYEQELCTQAQRDRIVADPWDATVAQYIEGKDEVTVSDILKFGLEKPESQITRGDSTRIGIALTKFGWRKTRETRNGQRMVLYRPPYADSGDDSANLANLVRPKSSQRDDTMDQGG